MTELAHRFRKICVTTRALFLALAIITLPAKGAELSQPINAWVKRSPLADTPPSPRLG